MNATQESANWQYGSVLIVTSGRIVGFIYNIRRRPTFRGYFNTSVYSRML